MAKLFSNTIMATRSKRVKDALKDQSKVFRLVLNNTTFKDMIIRLNTKEQLFAEGIDSTGTKLSDIGGGYSEYTKQIKREKGQPTDRVTLNDTGDFYKSFSVVVGKGVVTISANEIKEDTNLISEWGKDILGLTDENMEQIIDYAKYEYIKYLRKLWMI